MTLSIPPGGGSIERPPATSVALQQAITPAAAQNLTAEAVVPVEAVAATAALGDVRSRSGNDAQTLPADPEQRDRELQRATEDVNRYLAESHRALNFSIDRESGETVVKVMDTEKNEVIRQIPSEEVLALARRLRDGEEGYLVHAQA